MIKDLVLPILGHRLIIKPEAELRGRSVRSVLDDVLEDTPLDLGAIE